MRCRRSGSLHCAGPNYNYSGYAGTWDNTPIQINASNYYDASKHAFLQPGTQGVTDFSPQHSPGLTCYVRGPYGHPWCSPSGGTAYIRRLHGLPRKRMCLAMSAPITRTVSASHPTLLTLTVLLLRVCEPVYLYSFATKLG